MLQIAIEGRKRVKDQLMRIDATYADVNFSYSNNSGEIISVTTLEEDEYPQYYSQKVESGDAQDEAKESGKSSQDQDVKSIPESTKDNNAKEEHLTFFENQKGVSFDLIFSEYLRGAGKVTITDPYIRLFYQVRNLMEFIETIVKNKLEGDEVEVHLVTTKDEYKSEDQIVNLEHIKDSSISVGVKFTWEFDQTNTIHARHIVTDNGWKISLDRGLDIFQHYEMGDAFSFSNRLQEYRSCKAFEVTYIKNK
jgi:ATP-dependent Lon protease